MPRAYLNLYHAICTYHGQWIPGDERGWRCRDHRVHSSGDYKRPPPPEEHEGLRRHVRAQLNNPPVRLSRHQFEVLGDAFVRKLLKMRCAVRRASAGPTHVHVLLVPSEPDVLKQLGRAKQYASFKCPGHRGQLWGGGGRAIPIADYGHLANVLQYIADHAAKEGAWIWSDGE
jgi:REP element-mobilizing transposase RayT